MFYGAPPHIFKKARELRKNMTEAEKQLWERLKKRQLRGFKFRRQHPLAVFIVDFYCHSAHLVVEVDGGFHEKKEYKEYDAMRTEELDTFGLTTIRFTNEEVEHHINEVLKQIAIALEK